MDGSLEPIGLDFFFAGQSTDRHLGQEGQFNYSRSIDFRKRPSAFSLLPGPANADGGVVVDLVQDMEQINSGVRYAIGDAGYVYKITTSGIWSVIGNVGENGGAGMVYRSDVDHVYMTGQSKLSRISRVSTSAQFQQNWFENGVSTSTTCTKYNGSEEYTLQTTYNEDAANKRNFTTDIEPVYRLGVTVKDKGTGDWTLTLHDDANNELGVVTVTNANLNNNVINYFTFSSPIRLQRGASGGGAALTYHFHLTSTVADGEIATTTNASMANCDMELWANALVETFNDLHPITNFSNFTLIGNGRYVASYEPLQDSPTTSDFDRHRLTLPPGFEVCGFGQKNLMCVIGAEKRSSSGEFQEGMLLFWDGISETYNDFYPVPEGSPESIFSHKNTVYFVAGGALYRMRGSDEPVKIRTFRNTDSEYSGSSDITHSYPNMMTVRRGILLIGYPSTTTNQSLEHGIYSTGSITSEYPESFGFSYVTSNGNILNNGSNNLKLGMVKNFGDTLYVSWRDDSVSPQKYSVDIVNNSSNPAAYGTLETLIHDDNRPYAPKSAHTLVATSDPLPADCTIKLKYKIDNEADWNYSDTFSTEDQTRYIWPLKDGLRYKDLEFGIDVTCAGTTSPVINSLHAFVDLKRKEYPFGD